LKKPIGFPIIFRLPRTWNTSLSAYSLYFNINLSLIPSAVSKQFLSLIPFRVSGASSIFERATPRAVATTVNKAKFSFDLVFDLNDMLIVIGDNII